MESSNPLIDIYNNILAYNDTDIIIIIDDNNMAWFCANDIAGLLEYKDRQYAISQHVRNNYKTTFQSLQKYVQHIPSNFQPHTIFINEPGLYSLIFSSKMPVAEKFQQWVVEDVLPEIRKYGYYIMDKKDQTELKLVNTELELANEKLKSSVNNLRNKLKAARKKIIILENNQDNTKYGPGGRVYAIRSMDTDLKLIRIGKTTNLNDRIPGYNTTMPNKFKILYTLQVDSPEAVELCIRAFLHKYSYRNKDYYGCSLKEIKNVFNNCKHMIEKTRCEICNIDFLSFNSLVEHMEEKHQNDIDDLLIELPQFAFEQSGAGYNYYKYQKYKTKYLALKNFMQQLHHISKLY